MILRIPLCPWCDEEMKWLLDEDNFDRHQDTCKSCGRKVIIEGVATITFKAEKYYHLKSVPTKKENRHGLES